MTCHQFCRKMSAGEIETPCHVLWDECFYSNMFVLSRMVHWRLLPDITWGFVGDPSQPQQLGHFRGITCRNGLTIEAQKWSSYLPEKIIEKTVDKRSKCAILRDFRKRLREADQSDVPAFIQDCLLYTSPSPRDATLSRMPSSA